MLPRNLSRTERPGRTRGSRLRAITRTAAGRTVRRREMLTRPASALADPLRTRTTNDTAVPRATGEEGTAMLRTVTPRLTAASAATCVTPKTNSAAKRAFTCCRSLVAARR